MRTFDALWRKIPLLAWIAMALLTVGGTTASAPVSVQTTRAVVPMTTGLSTWYSQSTGEWHWQFVRTMEDGCRQLSLHSDSVKLSGPGQIDVYLYSSVPDDIPCAAPSRVRAMRGSIVTNTPDTRFHVFLDGKPASG